LTITKLGPGTFQVSRSGQSVTITPDQVFGDDAIDAAAALLRAIQRLFPNDQTWRLRYEYAVARWKLVGYQALINAAAANQRAPLRAKRDRWVTEEARLKALMGTDA
jgi:hypothetical protein